MKWRLIDSGPQEAAFNMALDEAIFVSVIDGKAPPTLRFYSWNLPSVSIGHFQRISDPDGIMRSPEDRQIFWGKGEDLHISSRREKINLNFCLSNNIPVVRRPTGGRAILHGEELTYSFSSGYNEFFSSTGLYETYKLISRCFVEGLRRFDIPIEILERKKSLYGHQTLCFMSTSFGEVILFGKKVLGSAQKRLKDGFLQQGSMPFYIDKELVEKIFLVPDRSLIDGLKGLFELLLENGMPLPSEKDIKSEIIKAFEMNFGIKFIKEEPSTYEIGLANKIKEQCYIGRTNTFV